MIKKICAAVMAAMLVFAAGCAGSGQQEENEASALDEISSAAVEDDYTEVTVKGLNLDSPDTSSREETAAEDVPQDEETQTAVEVAGEVSDDQTLESAADQTEHSGLIVIDPGHQAQGNNDTEPNGPGSSEYKAKVSSGTSGVSTGKNEYELNLEVSLKLRDELESRGYEVIMTRETHDVDISNAERAQVANDANADVFVRVHANGDDDHSVNGVITICQTSSNPYNANLYDESYLLSELVLDAVVETTGAKRQYVWETDTMTGINWAEVPSTIVEMGFMSNPEEDERMATDAYQYEIAEGIANGIDRYMDARDQ